MRYVQIGSALRGKTFCQLMLLIAFLLGAGSGADCQVLYGTITGNVTDSSGAVVPGATVQAINPETGFSRIVQTTGEGVYFLDALQPGTYEIHVTVSNFSEFKQVGVIVSPNQITHVDPKLQVQGTTQQVVVTDSQAQLQTDKADVNYEIAPVQLGQIPTSSTEGRNFQALYKFVPGFSPPSEQNSSAGNPERAQGVNANGISWVTNSTRVDGATVSYPWLPYLIGYIPPQDAIASINIVTNSFTAEQGTAGGSVINVTIKSGTNQFHGSAWEYNSIQQYNARSFFNIKPSPKNIYNEYGAAVGGPIIKNKLFFFADWDRTTRRQAISGNQSIPTPQTVGGDFQGLTAPGTSNQVQIYDPATGNPDGTGRLTFAQEYGTMAIPASRIDPAAATMLSLLPAVNNCASPCTNPINDFFGSGTFAYTLDKVDAKINYSPSEKNTMFGRYSIAPSDISDPPTLGAAGGGTYDGGQQGNATGRIQNVGLGFVHTFTPNLLLDMNAGYGRQRLGAQAPDITSNFGLDTLHIPGTNGPNALQGGQPAFVLGGSAAAGFGSGGGTSAGTYSTLGNPNSGSPFLFRDNQYVGNANLSWNKGRHSMKFGGEYTHSAINHFQPQFTGNSNLTARGAFIFGGGLTTLNGGAAPTTIYNQLADMLLGLPQSYGKTLQTLDPNAVRWSTFGFYAQDQWQATPRLTVTAGVRYEYYPFAVRDHEGVFRYDPSLGATNNIVVGGVGGNPTDTGEDVGWGRIVPRLGLAYRLSDKTVVRAGGGMTVDPDNFRTLRDTYGAVSALNPSGSNAYINPNCLQAVDVQNALPSIGCPVVGIQDIPTPDFSSGFLTLPTNTGTNTVPKNFHRGYIDSWNLAVEQQFAWGFIADITYVGTSAVRQMTSLDINAAPPGGGTHGQLLYPITGQTAAVSSQYPFKGANYNGLQTQLTRRATHGVQTGLIYTWSKAIDYNDNSTYNGLTFAYPTYWNRNRAVAGYDRPNNIQWWTVAESPFGKDGKYLQTGVGGKILGGWSLSTALSKASGTPFTVQDSGTFLNAPGNTQVAEQVKPSVAIGKTHARGNGSTTGLAPYFDTTAFAQVSSVTTVPRFGNSTRNEVRGPGFFNLDTSLQRTFPVWESVAFVARIEAFNVTNTPAFNNPAASVAGSNFGYVTSLVGSSGGRTLNLSGRINF